MRTTTRVAVLMAAAFASSCLYGFAGGGLPPHVRTVAILPFDNQTGDAGLTLEVSEAVRRALEDRLGMRISAEEQADAIVTGTITNYQADLPLSFQPPTAGSRNVAVTRRLVQIVVSVEIFDVLEQRALWQRSGMRVEGEYQPPQEQEGRELALEQLVTDIVDGAQSQW